MEDLTVTFRELMDLMPVFHRAKKVMHIAGPPGVGKSAAPVLYATEVVRLPLVDIRPARMNPVDLTGLPLPDREKNITVWTRPEIILDLPAVYVVEEIAAAARLMQVALHELTGDRKIGKYSVHPDSLIVTTGNRPEDMAHVEKMSSALRNRFVVINLRADNDCFDAYAARKGFHPMVTGFLKYRKELLSVFNGKTWDGVSGYPSPRSWEQVSELMNAGLDKLPLPMIKRTVAGAVGMAAAIEFCGYIAVHSRIVTPEMVVLDPTATKVPEDGVELWATASAVSLAMHPGNATALLSYMKRLPEEFLIFTLKAAMGRDRTLLTNPEFKSLVLKHQDLFKR